MPPPRWLRCCIALLALALVSTASAADSVRERLPFNAGWRFTKDDPAGTGDALSYAALKPWLLPTSAEFLNAAAAKPARPAGNIGETVAYTHANFDDSGWRKLDLPHDWGIEGPFKQEYPGSTGKLPWWGVGWYRKHFTVPAGDNGRRVYLDVDGAMSHAAVWLNGRCVGGWPYGYTSWRVDLTPYLAFGADNVLAIRLDNPPDSSRFYPGGGIYRSVWLVKTSPVHIAHWGTTVTTPSVSPERATLDVQVQVENETTGDAPVDVTTRIFALDPKGARSGDPVATLTAPTTRVTPHQRALVARTTSLAQPRLWSVKQPNRYVAVTTVRTGGAVVDEYETRFGIRTIAFDPERGFLLNGERVPIQGVCQHHDLGALGAAVNVRALQRQLEILRDMGCNAIRTSHNPPTPELLDLADEMGFLIEDEAFDCWAAAKRPQDYSTLFADWHEQDLRALIRRDRNHPSIILWSIGNEIREQQIPGGWELANHLAGITREEDRTRYVTAACNRVESGYNGFQTVLDVFGYNYKPTEYPKLHATMPQLPLYGSETSSCFSSRGVYVYPFTNELLGGRANFQVSSYDLYSRTGAWPPDVEFRGLDEAAPYTAGEFVWTGFDYLGEPTPYNSDRTNMLNVSGAKQKKRMAKELAEADKLQPPSRSSYYGIIDLAGFPKDRYFIYQARWRPDFPMAHLLPHWTWPDRVGQVTPVHVYTSGDEAELFLNGQSLGRKKRGPLEYRLRWDDVKYEPGEVRVVAYQHGAKWAEDVVRTAGPAAKLAATVDRATVHADGADLAFITVRVADANDTMVPQANPRVAFQVEGPADVIATDNGDATSFEPFQSPTRAAFNGMVLAIVRTRAGQSGTVTVRATSDGLQAGSVNFTAR